jgi:subtilisin family serine protease
MKILLVTICLFFLIINSFAQNKYYIYFKDKGISENSKLPKSSEQFILAEKELTSEAIKRRQQVMGDNYITFEDIPINQNYVNRITELGIKIQNNLKWFNAITAYLNNQQLEVVNKLDFVEKVELVRTFKHKPEENFPIVVPETLNKNNFLLDYGPSFTQNNLSEIPAVHDLGIKGTDVIIGILDTGFRWKTHPALQNNKVLDEWDFIQQDNNTANQPASGDTPSQDAHGTSVFSIMAGNASGSLIGPAYDSKFYLAKTEYVPTETNIEEDNYAAGIQWLESKGVHITSSSLGYSIFDPGQKSYIFPEMDGKTTIVAKAANLAFDRGVSTFTAAGNEGTSPWGAAYGGNTKGKIISPGDAFNIITVGAVDFNNKVVGFSSRGPSADGRIKPELVAMGSGVYNASANGGYGSGGGTSYATPITAGIAGLLKSAYPHLNNRQIRQIMIEAGDNVSSPNNDRGYGLISAKRAITFPNLNKINNVYRLNKIFNSFTNVKTNTAKVNYKVANGSLQNASMIQDGAYKFYFDLPIQNDGQEISFYFVYETSSASIREPASGEYKFKYGSLITTYSFVSSIDEEIISKDYQLLQNYPNPFNIETRIEFKSTRETNAALIIFNLLGQKVRALFTGQSKIGTNSIVWDGKDNNGIIVPSGTYFYSLNIDGKYLNKKMLLLK